MASLGAVLSWRYRPALAGGVALMLMMTQTWLSSLSDLDLPDASWPGRDKVAHGTVWFALGVLLTLIVNRPSLRVAALAIATAIGFGISDELHQSLVPGRDASIFDLLADTVGATLGALTVAWYSARRWPQSSIASAESALESPPTSSSPTSPP